MGTPTDLPPGDADPVELPGYVVTVPSMADAKTQSHDGDVPTFLDGIADPQRREDAKAASDLIGQATGASPKMWGPSIVGFGDYHYSYDSGREGDTFVVGFSPRKANLTLYLMNGFEEYGDLLDRLGKHSIGKACLYIKRMSDIDQDVLQDMVTRSYAQTSGSEAATDSEGESGPVRPRGPSG